MSKLHSPTITTPSSSSSRQQHHQIEPQSHQYHHHHQHEAAAQNPEAMFDRSQMAAAIVPIKTKLRPTSPAFYPAGFAHKEFHEDTHDKTEKPHLPPVIDEAELGVPMTGIVHNLKHAYGFVKCEDSGERIFFHYSDIDPSTAATFGPVAPDLPPVIIGDQVRFRKVIDEPTGKQKAIRVEVVRRPARNVAIEPKPELQHEESATSNNPDEYKSVHDPSAARETGVVVSAKQNYGFIKCAEREHKQVFFHFSEIVGVRDPAQIQPGLEVLFSLSTTSSGRVVATRVQTLPPGTISFFTIESSVLYGFVETGLESSHTSSQKTRRRARPSSNDSATLVLPAKERARLESTATTLPMGKDTLLTFTGVDLKFPGIKLVHGDQVGFRLKLDRRTHTYSATDIFLIRCAPAGRKRGILTIWKDMYGFLKMDGSKDQMFVHQNEFIEKSHRPAVGDELEFNIAPDNHGQENAVRISVLPKGTVQLFDDRVFGVITEQPSLIYPAMPEPIRRALTAEHRLLTPTSAATARAQSADTTPVYGAIRLLHEHFNPGQRSHKLRYRNGDADEDLVRFVMADLDLSTAQAVRIGDVVSMALAPAPKFRRCANIQLLPKTGAISAVANNQIVIKVEGNDVSGPELFEFLCDDDGAELDLAVGEKVEIDQIEAGIAPMSMRIARRLRSLKKHGAGQQQQQHVGVGRNHKPTLKKSVSMDLSPASYRRWDLRLEPRNWS